MEYLRAILSFMPVSHLLYHCLNTIKNEKRLPSYELVFVFPGVWQFLFCYY